MIESVCPQCDRRNRWEELYCGHCGACLKGAELVQQEEKPRRVGLRAGGVWLLVLLALLLSLSGMAALLGGFFL